MRMLQNLSYKRYLESWSHNKKKILIVEVSLFLTYDSKNERISIGVKIGKNEYSKINNKNGSSWVFVGKSTWWLDKANI